MTSFASGQDEPNLALWLAIRAGKMELSCPLGIRALSRKENLSCFGVLSFIDQACSVKMAGYWPRSFFACLWNETQPSWPHAWSITHIYVIYRPRGPYWEKLCPRSWVRPEAAGRGPCSRPRAQFFPIQTDLGRQITCLFFSLWKITL